MLILYMYKYYTPCEVKKTWWGLYVLGGRHGITHVLLERWYACGGYMDVSEVVSE